VTVGSPPAAPRSPFRASALERQRLGRDQSVLPRLPRLLLTAGRRRVPVILQMSTAECGAACLAMILGYFGRATTLDECRHACGVSRDGLSTKTLAEAARRFGLRARGFSIEPDGFRHVSLPAIAHWNFNHFLIVERWSPDRIEVVDPATGRQQLSAAEFDAGFTGVVLTFEPTPDFAPRQAVEQPGWRRALDYLSSAHGVRTVALEVVVATVLLQVLGLSLPLLTGVVVDQVIARQAMSMMGALGLGIALVVAVVAVLGFLRAATLVHLRARVDSHLMLDFFDHLLALPFSFFEGRKSGQLVSRLASNVVIREALTNQTLSSLLDAILVVSYLALLLLRAPDLGLLVAAIAAIQVAIVVATTPPLHRLVARELTAAAESQGYLVEALRGIGLLKATGAEARVHAQWANLFTVQLNLAMDRGRLSAFVEASATIARLGIPLVLLWLGAGRVLDGSTSLGTMLALNALALATLLPLASLLATGQQLQLVGAHLQRILDVMDTAIEQAPRPDRQTSLVSGRVEVANLSFRYGASGPLVLRDVTFSAEPGQKVALVGRSGSGKSTLISLLLGLREPTAGGIRYDGIPLAEFDYRALRNQVGVVPQDPFLFSTTVRQNIAFHEPTLPMAPIVAAAKIAGIHDEIAALPMRYDTLLAEGGASLSGGQRQRLQIARAVVRLPRLVLLDEATSHLDTVTERHVDEQLSALSCTRIVIAHRLTTVRNADLILVFDEGEIVERGTHAELLALGGQYAALIAGQLDSASG
jgi:ATP-binding cassette, subfamily B, bacterial